MTDMQPSRVRNILADVLRRLFPLRVTQWIGPFLVAGVAAALVAILVISSGFLDLSARKPHPEGWARILHFTFQRSTAFHAHGVKPPADLDSPVRIAAGAAYYGQVCMHCHGGPGFGQNPVVLMMHPKPQYLTTDLALPDTRYSPAELFRILTAGVKYSAMPAWPATGRDDEVWQMVAFLRALPRMTPEQFRALALIPQQQPAADAGTRAFGDTPQPRPYALVNRNEPPVRAYNYQWPVLAFGGDESVSGDPARTCSRCHGTDGRGAGAFPNLTVLDPRYINRTLVAFANGQRRSGFMRVMASQLSPRQMGALASYYAAMPRKATDAAAPADSAGQKIALVGDAALGLGPCAGCHGEQGASARAYPSLEGQSAWYIANQMRVFRAGGRGGVEGRNPMPAIASKLDDRRIEAVARYYASQPPVQRQSFAAVASRQ